MGWGIQSLGGGDLGRLVFRADFAALATALFQIPTRLKGGKDQSCFALGHFGQVAS
jgi:hypothetical protein